MCGIAGILKPYYSIEQTNENLYERVALMVDAISHRGPDESGVWIKESSGFAVGHRRLSIIDLSMGGHQPMESSCGRYVIAYNGEIYNYLELKDELKSHGSTFRSHSDTEVILESISRWGIDKSLNEFRGMFAFALWDKKDSKLVLARDRVGKKPLYYCKTANGLYFSSEMKAIKKLNPISLTINNNSLHQYLTFGFVPSPNTIYKEIIEVPPGHYISISRDMKIESKIYWDVKWGYNNNITFEEAVEEMDLLLRDAIKMRLRSDVPVGIFLSGGIDSGLITALASNYLGNSLKTLTVSSDAWEFDESSLASLVAKKYNTDHQVIKVSSELIGVLHRVVRAYDEPFADPSAIPSFLVSQEARKQLKVVLNGDGGDELFGGYRRHMAIKFLSKYEKLFGLIPSIAPQKINNYLPLPKAYRSYYAFIHRFLRGMNSDSTERYISWCADGFTEEEKRNLYKDTSGNGCESSIDILHEKFDKLNYLSPLDYFMAMDFLFQLPDCLLVKMDIATMAHGLEARSPLLDYKIVEFAFAIPPGIRMKGFKTKPILRALAKKYLPEEVVNAPKRGFEIPLIKWLREDLFDMVYDTCFRPNGIVMEIFDRKYVEDLLFERHSLDPDRWSRRVWILFMLSMWGQLK